jgi:thiamine-phosphate pyrophosphorylase
VQPDFRLYIVTDPTLSQGRDHLEVVRAALAGGATTIQFRDKFLVDRQFFEVGQQLRVICREAGATFIVNDHLDIALALEADGVHLGPNDLPPDVARRLVPSDFLIGVSVDNISEAHSAIAQGANYLGAGPVFPTRTKLDTGPVLGVAGLQAVVAAVTVPVVGIGSINATNLAEVLATGVAGAAIISAAVGADDITQAVASLRDIAEKSYTYTK